MSQAYNFSRGFFGVALVPGTSSSSSSGGFVGTYTTAGLAGGTNLDVLPVGAGWPGTLANPYGRVDFTVGGVNAAVAGVVNGLDGQIMIYRNTTGAAITILNESGLDATAANRFSIGPGDLDIENGASFQAIYYAGAVNRWVVQQ